MISQEKLFIPTTTKTTSSEKPVSLLSTLILSLIAIAFYGWGIQESSKIVTNIVEIAVKETIRDYQF